MLKKLILLFSFIYLQVSVSFSQSIDAELVNQETTILYKDGILVTKVFQEVRINNKDGIGFSEISIPYSRMTPVSKIEAYIKSSNGKVIRKLKKKEITSRSAYSNSFYTDNFVKEFSLQHNVFPYSICYSYEIEEHEFFYIIDWKPIIDYDCPTINASLKLEIPKDYKISYKSNLADLSIDSSGIETNKYIWSSTYKQNSDKETDSPSIEEYLPSVEIVPKKFKYDKEGSCESWTTFGNYVYDLGFGLSELPQSEKTKINNKLVGITNEREKIKKLYNYLQDETRYVSISIETGGLKPYSAAYVAINKFGDCKALANYFKSMLDYVGIKSYYTLVNAGIEICEIDKTFTASQFNHVIVCVPLKNDTLWVDCTSNDAFGYIGTFIQNRDGFAIEKDNSRFIHIPALTKENVAENRKISFKEIEKNQTSADFNISYKGNIYEYLSYYNNETSEELKLKYIKMYLVEAGFDSKNYQIIKFNRDSSKINLKYSAESGRIYSSVGNETLIKVISFYIPKLSEPKIRKLPLQLNYPIYKIDSLEYQIPEGYTVSNKFETKNIKCDFGEYSISYVQNGNMVQIIKNIYINSGIYSSETYVELYNFTKQVAEIEKKAYIVTKKI